MSLQAYRRLADSAMTRANGSLQHFGASSGVGFYAAAVNNDRAAAHERSISIPVALGRQLSEVINPPQAPASPAERRRDRQQVWAMLRDVQAPADPSTRVHVFVNRDGVDARARAGDPHYATSLSFFGVGHGAHDARGQHGHHSHHRAQAPATTSVCVDLTPALTRIRGTRQFRTDKIVVQLMPICRYGNSTTSVVRPRRVEIAIL
jgi:hypothetical protein